MVKKPAGTLPIRKHKLSSTSGTGQAITKFFDRKEEQARLQQQLSKKRPAGPPPVFAAHAAGPKAPAEPVSSVQTTAVIPTAGISKTVHITSASVADGDAPLSRPAVPDRTLQVAEHNLKHAQQQPEPQHDLPQTTAIPMSASPIADGDGPPVTSAVQVKRPRPKGPQQASLDWMMSQDDDGCRIKWQASPQHANLTPSQAEAAAGSVPNQDLTAMKLRLANAVQRSAGSSSDSEKRSQASEGRDTLLDDLLALPPPQHSRLQKVTSLDRIGSRVLSPGNRISSLGKSGTPGSGAGSALKTPRLEGGSCEDARKQVTFGTESETGMHFSPGGTTTGSVIKKKPKRLQKANENSGTGGKKSAVRKRKALIELLDQVELLVQSRSVREKLDSKEALQTIPERPSQEALLSQQEGMLQEIQNSQDRMQGQQSQAKTSPSTSDHRGPHQNSSQKHSTLTRVSSPHSSPGNTASQESEQAANMQGTGVMQESSEAATKAVATTDQESNKQTAAERQALLVDTEQQSIVLLLAADLLPEASAQSSQQTSQSHVDEDAAAAPQLGNNASGMLAVDDFDDLDFEVAQQMEDAARAAKGTQQMQQAQQAAHAQQEDIDRQQQPGSACITSQADHPIVQQHAPKPAMQAGLNAQADCPTAGESDNALLNMSKAPDAFQDSDMVIDDDLAQLLDAATALRPAGPPDTALAGPGPASTSSSWPTSRSTSPRSRPGSADSHSRLPLPRSRAHPLNHQADLVYDTLVCEQTDKAANATRSSIHTADGVANSGQAFCDLSLPARQNTGVLALEPAGPADLDDQPVLPQLAGDRVKVHYLVKDVHVNQHEKVLHLEGSYTQEQVVVHLQDGWHDTPVQPGHSVNLIAEKVMGSDGLLHAVCDFNAGMLVLHPDLLLSGTRISGSFRCQRQSVLEERFAGSSNDKAVEGTLMHEVFQAALTKRITNKARLEEVACQVIASSTDKLFEVGLDEHKAMARLRQAIPSMLSWVQRFLRPQPAKNATVAVRPGEGVAGGNTRPMCVRQVVDIEENVWAPKYGLKGMIDASLAATFHTEEDVPKHKGWLQNAAHSRKAPGAQCGDAMIPLEFKTGKPFGGHNAQVSLYLLLMQERYSQIIESGLLWYLGSVSPQQVKLVPQELQSLIQLRNWLAAYIVPGQPLPEVVRDERICGKCFQKSVCALSHMALENGNEASSGLGPAYTELTGHLSEASTSFFQHWLTLVELEEAPLQSKRAEIWKCTGQQREKAGRCIANLVLNPVVQTPAAEPSARVLPGQVARNKLLYTAARAPQADGDLAKKKGGDALDEKGFAEGDMAVLSIEGQQACVCRPTVAGVSASAITLAVDKPLRGAMLGSDVRWRLDKDEVSSIFTRMRCNLMDLMDPGLEHVQCIRCLVADLETPVLPQNNITSRARDHNSGLNEDQEAAVDRVLSTSDYALILGMPGTGKTSTIVQAIKGLIAQGKSMLLTSYTNSAVDNVLLKLLQEGVHFLRLGRTESVHPMLQGWTLGGGQYPDTSVKALTLLSQTAQVVACTALGVNHCLLKGRVFDMCIVDEAGQMTLPVALGPILHSKAFTLVGDHYQLPPLVTSRAAEEGGLGISLFKLLCDKHPQAVVALRAQYRMAADIMLLANTIVYDGQLRCGADHVADAVLDLQVAPTQISHPKWLNQVLAPQQRVLFLDTDEMPAPEVRAGDALRNPAEAAIITQIVRALEVGKVPLQDIGIISPYRAQVLLMSRICKNRSWSEVEVLTVDKCQGRDKDVVLLSFVRSNGEHNAGNLLHDWRRLNVAITRAKKKLILIGSQTTLRTVPHFGDLLNLMSQQQWLLPLPNIDGPA